MVCELYSQLWDDQLPARGLFRAGQYRLVSTKWLRLVNENNEPLSMAHSTFLALMSLAEQRGWRATAFTRGDLSAFSAADASRCAVILCAALEDGIPPIVAVGTKRTVSQLFLDHAQAKCFIDFCRQGGFWIRPVERETARGIT